MAGMLLTDSLLIITEVPQGIIQAKNDGKKLLLLLVRMCNILLTPLNVTNGAPVRKSVL